jgi:hypothetical protein
VKTKKIFSLLLIICIIILTLCGCETSKNDVATNDEIVLPTTTETVETFSENTNDNLKDKIGVVKSNSDVQIVEYDKNLAKGLKAPETVGASVFTVLTTNIEDKAVVTNIDSNEELVKNMNKYNTVLSTDTFNISYNEKDKQLEYFVCDFSTTYAFGSPVEMFSVYSPLFDKNISYLIKDMKYDNANHTMYMFLKEGWPYYEEAHTTDQESILKDGIKKAKGAVILFFNELNEDIKPEHYVLIMPEK